MKKSCHKCIHNPVCKFYDMLLKKDFRKIFESQNIQNIAEVCYYYWEKK